jgi:hypothetical protein
MPKDKPLHLIELLTNCWQQTEEKKRARECRINRLAARLALRKERKLPTEQRERIEAFCDGRMTYSELRGGEHDANPAWHTLNMYLDKAQMIENRRRPGWGWNPYQHASERILNRRRIPCDRERLDDLCRRHAVGAVVEDDELMVELLLRPLNIEHRYAAAYWTGSA